jgi:hypothetical protein
MGQRFHRLTVIAPMPREGKNPRWRCLCDCGNEATAYSYNLRAGKHKSCGCYKKGPTSYKAVERTFQDGYAFLRVPGHPRANPHTGRVREHILVMEKLLGRPLLPGEEVHHKNTDRADNTPSNLELWTHSHPAGARVSDKVEWAIELLQLYAPERLKMTG